MVAYHDREWGVPLRDDRALFEFLVLEGAQAGLSWSTILKRREGYREAMDGLDPRLLAGWGDQRIETLMSDPRIIRNRRKIESARSNARAFLRLAGDHDSFAGWLWQFVDGRPVVNSWRTPAEVPARTALSDTVSRELRQRGFSFVGSVICYAYLQAVGVVDDHLVSCFRHTRRRDNSL